MYTTMCKLRIKIRALEGKTRRWSPLTFGSWPSSAPTGFNSSVRVSLQLSSRARRRKVSPSKQSSARGRSFLANGSGWQHQSSTMAFQFPLGSGRTLLNTLEKRRKLYLLPLQKQPITDSVIFLKILERINGGMFDKVHLDKENIMPQDWMKANSLLFQPHKSLNTSKKHDLLYGKGPPTSLIKASPCRKKHFLTILLIHAAGNSESCLWRYFQFCQDIQHLLREG